MRFASPPRRGAGCLAWTRHELGPSATERMAERDGPAIRVDARGVQAGLLNDGQRLRGEGFVELNHGNVSKRKPGELQGPGDGSRVRIAEI